MSESARARRQASLGACHEAHYGYCGYCGYYGYYGYMAAMAAMARHEAGELERVPAHGDRLEGLHQRRDEQVVDAVQGEAQAREQQVCLGPCLQQVCLTPASLGFELCLAYKAGCDSICSRPPCHMSTNAAALTQKTSLSPVSSASRSALSCSGTSDSAPKCRRADGTRCPHESSAACFSRDEGREYLLSAAAEGAGSLGGAGGSSLPSNIAERPSNITGTTKQRPAPKNFSSTQTDRIFR